MGYFAAALDGDDTAPVEDFSLPPPAEHADGHADRTRHRRTRPAPDRGRDRRASAGTRPASPATSPRSPTPTGDYTIAGIFAGTYPKVFARAPGFDPVVATVSIARGAEHEELVSCGATGRRSAVAARWSTFNGPDFTEFGCGPTGAIDQSLGTGWGSTSDFVNGVDRRRSS